MPAAAYTEPDLDVSGIRLRLRGRLLAIALCGLVGLGAGYVAWREGAHDFRGRTTIFVTETSTLAQPSALAAVARSQAVLDAASRASDIPAWKLAGSLSATQVGSSAGAGGLTFQVSTRGPSRDSAVSASDAIAQALLDRLAAFQIARVATVRTELASTEEELGQARQRSAAVEALSLDPSARLTALGLAQQAESIANERLAHLRTTLALVQTQRSKVISTTAIALGARGRLSSALVGGAIGILLGIVGALALPPGRPLRARATGA